jgi:tetratricopeptide (TPR) repeat protein
MYLNGSKWHVNKKRRPRSNPLRVLALLLLVGGAVYLERFIVPTVPPLFVPTLTPTRSPASIVLEAESLYQAGKLDQAEQAYQEAIQVDPQQSALYVALARVQVFSGKYQEAETNARDALLVDPNSAIANAVLAWALDFQAGESTDSVQSASLLSESETQIGRALSLDPNSALAKAYHAEILMDAGDYAQALEEAKAAVAADPNLLEAQRALGYVWERTDNPDQAIEAYQTALRINPNLPMLHIALGDMYLKQGNTDQAVNSYLKASALAPTNSIPLGRIALAYARVGEYGKASQYASNAVDQDPSNPRLHGDLGRMFYKNNDFPNAVSELRLAIEGGQAAGGQRVQGLNLDPGDAKVVELYYTYGLALAKNNQCSQGVPIFDALLHGVPDDEIATTNAYQGLVICGEIQPTATPAGGTPAP